ncbi:Wzz/FepE/Etk N-terminal domain-containing protein [Viscerimonas tarda]
MADTGEKKETEIDIIELVNKLWKKRLFILVTSGVGFVIGIVVAFSIPKEYKTEVVLVSEPKGKVGGNIGVLASMTGMNIGNSNSSEAIAPEFFPNILSSTPFIVGLFDVRVVDRENQIDTTLYAYIETRQKSAWWNYIMGLPFMLFASEEESSSPAAGEGQPSGPISLSATESAILQAIKGRLNVTVDKKTDIITLTSTMQSPEISAYIADTVISYLQSYVINYRTEKARKDLIFAENLFSESKAEYDKAQQAYASYLDANMNITSARYKTTQDRLREELSLAYSIYSQTAQQLQMARIKVQDQTPVYSVIQPAVKPLLADSPKKKIIIIGFAFVFAVFASGWILVKDFLADIKNSLKQ